MPVLAQDTLIWKIKHPVSGQLFDGGSAGSVQEKLFEKGELPDPFWGENESLYKWIEDSTWQFVSMIEISEEMMKKEIIDLYFPSIDTYADIFINGTLIAQTENAFLPHHFNIKPCLRKGKNEIKVVFSPPVVFWKEKYKKIHPKLPAPNDVYPTAIAPYVRKPQYQFGWDWTLRMNTIGFMKPVTLSAYNVGKIMLGSLSTSKLTTNQAELKLTIKMVFPLKGNYTWRSKLFGDFVFEANDKACFNRTVQLNNPNLWWPRGQGAQNLYEDTWQLIDANNVIIDEQKMTFGVRTVELVQEKDQWGTSYSFRVNNRSIFCKGGNYIPQEVFSSKVSPQDIVQLLEQLSASNFNMVRVWGGGYYPDEIFFQMCDKLGLMVWQDCMFACAMYPGDKEFLKNVKAELDYQVPRIASHPSVVLFNGNNEVDVAWKNWGFQVKYGIYGKDAKKIEDAYNALFKELIPNVVTAYSSTPYIHTSPLSNWGKAEYYNHGSQHYWGVWHGKDPMDDFANKIGRFNAEYGFQSFPEFSTIAAFAEKKDWDLDSKVMKHHQKSYVGNGMILKHAKLLYGEPKNFEEFVYFSQLTQDYAVGIATAGHRLDAPRCMGTLYWQINDCWPAPTWSSIDYFGNWKALQYTIEQNYRDVTILTSQNEYYLVSDRPDTLNCSVEIKLHNLNGELIKSDSKEYLLNGNFKQRIDLNNFSLSDTLSNYYLSFNCSLSDGTNFVRNFTGMNVNRVKPLRESIDVSFASIDPIQKKARICIKNNDFVRRLWISSSIKGVRFSDNFLDLLPGEHFIDVQFDQLPNLNDLNFMWL